MKLVSILLQTNGSIRKAIDQRPEPSPAILGSSEPANLAARDVVHGADQGHDGQAGGDKPPPHAQQEGAPEEGVVHHQTQRDGIRGAQADEIEGGRGEDPHRAGGAAESSLSSICCKTPRRFSGDTVAALHHC